jgi:hypothetical protein
MKLEVGMYARYGGVIKKIKELVDLNEREYKLNGIYIDKKSVQKASYDIIDLIKVGDYVNGKKIVDVGCLTNGPRKGTKVIDYYITPSAVCYLENEDIKSIVTKELFEIAEYRIGE